MAKNVWQNIRIIFSHPFFAINPLLASIVTGMMFRRLAQEEFGRVAFEVIREPSPLARHPAQTYG